MANIVRNSVQATVVDLMVQAIDQSERRRQVKTALLSFALGVLASLAASVIYAFVTAA